MREWKHSASKESRRLRVEARRERRREQEARQREVKAREVALRAALARRPDSPIDAVERLLVDEAEAPRAQRLRDLLGPVAERAPRLICGETLAALKLVAEADWVRPPSTWQPSGKSQNRLFRSLAEHVLARYRKPPFLWSAFFADEDAAALARIAVHVAAGGSLYQAVQSGLMPVPLTRSMCHELMSRGGEARFLDAVRRVQVKAAGGDGRLFRTWIATRTGRRLHRRTGEEFWQTVLGPKHARNDACDAAMAWPARQGGGIVRPLLQPKRSAAHGHRSFAAPCQRQSRDRDLALPGGPRLQDAG
jgi:hypothetical protein